MKRLITPVNASRLATIVGVKAARAAVRTHTTAVKTAPKAAQALARMFHPAK